MADTAIFPLTKKIRSHHTARRRREEEANVHLTHTKKVVGGGEKKRKNSWTCMQQQQQQRVGEKESPPSIFSVNFAGIASGRRKWAVWASESERKCERAEKREFFWCVWKFFDYLKFGCLKNTLRIWKVN
jgi:hypothetical protein